MCILIFVAQMVLVYPALDFKFSRKTLLEVQQAERNKNYFLKNNKFWFVATHIYNKWETMKAYKAQPDPKAENPKTE